MRFAHILKTTLVRYEPWCSNSFKKLNFKSVSANMRIFCFHFILSPPGRKVLTKSLLILLFFVAKEALGNLQTTCSKSRDLIGLWTQITCFQIVCSRPSVSFHPLVFMSGP